MDSEPVLNAQSTLESLEESLDWELWKGDFPFWKHAVSGSCAGVMEHVVLFPLDTIKTRVQAMKISILDNSSDSGGSHTDLKRNISPQSREPIPPISSTQRSRFMSRFGYRSFQRGELRTAIQHLIEEGGPARFFRGVTAITYGCVPAHACYFSAYEITKYHLGVGSGNDFLALQSAACGAAATMSHDFILTPMDLVKQRLQLGCYNGPLDCIRTVFKNEGYLAFFRSMPTTLVMNIPFGAVTVSANELMKHLLGISNYSSQDYIETHNKKKQNYINHNSNETTPSETPNEVPKLKTISSTNLIMLYFVCAGLSGGLAGFFTNPLDVIKTRLQTQDIEVQREQAFKTHGSKLRISPTASMKYRSFTSTIKTMWAEERLFGFWRGTFARMALSIPATAVSWGTYESVKYLLTSNS